MLDNLAYKKIKKRKGSMQASEAALVLTPFSIYVTFCTVVRQLHQYVVV